ncbi:hypothetical protein ACK8HY_14255 [Sphingobacterium sp. NGMCC 1.201703]|uniref:hypothetical protein n=1 Tax=Sphingobacterium sp. NGMCC 1.201703 TaxID=3388657 RepID=UPI0039FCCFA0
MQVQVMKKQRSPILNNEVIVHTHEWSGYASERHKVIKYTANKFLCGLRFHFERLQQYRGIRPIRNILTVSDLNDNYSEKLKSEKFFDKSVEIYGVPNRGMDFGGYGFVVKNLIAGDNRYIFLTNTSINADSAIFIDEYTDLFSKHSNLGLLGISYSSKVYQSLIRDNYTPHVQSFFLLTTTDILREITAANGGVFPGENEDYKLSIIRFGEARLSQITLSLGYDIGIVNEEGRLQLLPVQKDSSLVEGDYRLFIKKPNFINKIINE